MIKAGGILAIIAGLLGLLAGVVTLFMGGLGAAFSADGAGMIVGMGWGGILFSLLVVVYGATAFAAPRAGATGLALSAIAGMALGGMLVAILMVPALIAAVMVWFGKAKLEAGQQPVASGHWKGMAAAAVAPILAAVLIGGQVVGSKESASASTTTGGDAQIARIGQTVHSARFDVTVRGMRLADVLGGDFGAEKATPGTVFAVLDVVVRCVDKESRFYTVGDLLVELDGKTLKFDRSETVLGLSSPVGSINPMMEKSGYVVYKIPTAAANAPMYWTPGRGFDKVRFSLNAPVAPMAAQSAVSPAPTLPAASAPMPNEGNASGDQAGLAGDYADPHNSLLKIRRQATGLFKFSLEAVSPNGNTGSAEGDLTAAGSAYTWRDAEFDCLLTFHPSGNSISVAQKGSCGFGMGVGAEGTYRRRTGP
ncbi:MAG: DUF4352 domain-containing protein [Burkholderiaceae bacterium]|nr:DUF4352 domain-containing protein [Sulfuritalea sp.]MCF8173883.1 DUF4352 domain-containing protein [Burkholderiaceae bacterium]